MKLPLSDLSPMIQGIPLIPLNISGARRIIQDALRCQKRDEGVSYHWGLNVSDTQTGAGEMRHAGGVALCNNNKTSPAMAGNMDAFFNF